MKYNELEFGSKRKPIVLIVDDDVNVIHGYTRALRNAEIELYTAQSAEEARDALKRSRIDMVVTDECMAGDRGTELLRWTAEFFPDVVGVVLTGQPSVESMAGAINDSGVYKYLLKPITPEELNTVIFEALKLIVKK